MAGNGRNMLEMAGIGLNWLEMAGMVRHVGGHSLTWVEVTGNGWKWWDMN